MIIIYFIHTRVDQEQAFDYGHIAITSKETSQNDLNQMNIETWSQMGELLWESIERAEHLNLVV